MDISQNYVSFSEYMNFTVPQRFGSTLQLNFAIFKTKFKYSPVLKTLFQDLSDATLTLSKIQKMSDSLIQSKAFLRWQKKMAVRQPPGQTQDNFNFGRAF